MSLVLVLGACSADEEPDDEATATTEVASPDELVAAALGTGIDTQDFHLVLDLAVLDGDGEPTSVHDQVLDRAREGLGTPTPVTEDGLLTFTPTDGLEGRVVDPDGVEVPGARLDVGLLSVATGAAGDDAFDAYLAALDPDGTSGVDAADAPRELLVLYSSVDLDATAAHVDLRDQFELDLTFVDGLEPGDDVRTTLLYGQTLRSTTGPESDDPAEVFAQRIIEDRVLFQAGANEGGPAGVQLFELDSTAIEGSTLVRNAGKVAAIAAVTIAGTVAGGVCLAGGVLSAGAVLAGCLVALGIGSFTLGLTFSSIDSPADLLTPTPVSFGEFLADANRPDPPNSCPAGGERTSSGRRGPWTADASVGRPGAAKRAATERLVLADAELQPPPPEPDGPDPDGPGPDGPPEPGGEPGAGGCGEGAGEVHMRTLDRAAYNFQAVGEFVASRSELGHEVQLRTAPYGARVSVISGVAARIAGAELSARLVDDELVLHVDGEPFELPRGARADIGDGGVLVDTGPVLLALWPDGSQLQVHTQSGYLDATFANTVAPGGWVGLLGDGDGDPTGDLRLPDGTVVDEDFETIHGPFADAWRVTDETSMFHYEDGESTETFTDRSFPSVVTRYEDLDEQERAEAEATCRDFGIFEPLALADCVYDLVVTGDLAFLWSAALLQRVPEAELPRLAGGADDDPTAAPTQGDERTVASTLDETLTGEVAAAGDVVRHEFEATARERVWVQVVDVNGDCVAAPDEHLGWTLVGPDELVAGSSGDIRSCGDTGPILLEAGGTWTLVVDAGPDDPSTGSYTIRLLGVPADDVTSVAIGDTIAGAIEAVGASDHHAFEADAGQRVWIDVLDVNGDCEAAADEHIGWVLTGPDELVAGSSGDVRTCSDTGPIVLEAGGTWTLTVTGGPNDPSTGTYSIDLLDVPDDDVTSVAIGDTIAGAIETVGVADQHEFEADAGEQVWIDVLDVNGDCEAAADEHIGWVLTGPDELVAGSSGDVRTCSVSGPVVLEAAGTWTLTVTGGPNDPSTGSYTLRLLDEAP